MFSYKQTIELTFIELFQFKFPTKTQKKQYIFFVHLVPSWEKQNI